MDERLPVQTTPKASLSKMEAAGLTAIQLVAILGIPFGLFGLLFNRRDCPEFLCFWFLLLVGCVALVFLQRWAAVLVCGLGWFVQLTFVRFGLGDDAASASATTGVVVWAVSFVATVLFTALILVFGRHLRNGRNALRY